MCAYVLSENVQVGLKHIAEVNQTQAAHKSCQWGCVRQDRSEQRVFTVIKVNSGQPHGIALLFRHVSAALCAPLYGVGPPQ